MNETGKLQQLKERLREVSDLSAAAKMLNWDMTTYMPPADGSCLRRRFPETEQLAFGGQVIADFGFDFERGRQDKTHHPHMTRFSLNDVRITTRVREDLLSEALFSTLHESGHAL